MYPHEVSVFYYGKSSSKYLIHLVQDEIWPQSAFRETGMILSMYHGAYGDLTLFERISVRGSEEDGQDCVQRNVASHYWHSRY